MQLSHLSIRNHELHRRLRIPPSTANLQQNIAFRLKDLETVAAHGNRDQSPMLRKFPLRRVITACSSRVSRERTVLRPPVPAKKQAGGSPSANRGCASCHAAN